MLEQLEDRLTPAGTITNSANVVAVPVTTTAQPATIGFNPAQQTVLVTASLSSSAMLVGEGSVLFQVRQNTTVLASALGGVLSNTAQTVLTLPVGLATGTYTLAVSYSDPTGRFADGGDINSTLTVGSPQTPTPPPPPVVITKVVTSFTTSNSGFSVTVQATASDGSSIGPGLSLPFFFFPFPMVGNVTENSAMMFDVHLDSLFFGLFPFPLDVFFDSSGKLTNVSFG
jgi:hypothetical protein